MGEDPEVFAIACALAHYVSANPLAADTPDGIYRWWLGPNGGSMEKLTCALTWMTEQGLMEEQVAADGRARYRRCANDDDLKRMLDRCVGVAAARH